MDRRRFIPKRSTSLKASSIKWTSSTSKGGRPSCARSIATITRTPSPTRASSPRHVRGSGRGSAAAGVPWRSPRCLARGWLQENQVLHERERGLRRAGPAGAADAYDWYWLDGAIRRSWRNCRSPRTTAGTGSWAFLALGQVAQLLLMCDRHDIGVSIDSGEDGDHCAGPHPVRLFIYDNYPGGIGFSEPLFRMHQELLDRHRAVDCRVSVREWMPWLRRADRQHGTAGKDCRAPNSEAADRKPFRSGAGVHSDGPLMKLADRLRGTSTVKACPGTVRNSNRVVFLVLRLRACWVESGDQEQGTRPCGGRYYVVERRLDAVMDTAGRGWANTFVQSVSRRSGVHLALDCGTLGTAAVSFLRSGDDRPERRRRHVRVSRRMRMVFGGWFDYRDPAVHPHRLRRRGATDARGRRRRVRVAPAFWRASTASHLMPLSRNEVSVPQAGLDGRALPHIDILAPRAAILGERRK